MKSLQKIGLACAFATTATLAVAGLKASGAYPANFSFATPTALVPLTSTGGTTLTFNLGSAGRKILTFSAECAVAAPAGNSSAWVDIDIVVNGVAVTPTNQTNDAFCGANGTAIFDGWVRPSITLVIPGIAGVNTVQVLARLNGGATGGWLSDSATVIIDP